MKSWVRQFTVAIRFLEDEDQRERDASGFFTGTLLVEIESGDVHVRILSDGYRRVERLAAVPASCAVLEQRVEQVMRKSGPRSKWPDVQKKIREILCQQRG